MSPDNDATVLIVDDDAAIRRGVSRLARSAGYAVQTFASPQEMPAPRRALGWEVPTGSNSAGTRWTTGGVVIGHTGFTGTSLWMDLDRDLFVLLLTNRVNPTRENRRIGGVRVALADAVWGALGGDLAAPTGR